MASPAWQRKEGKNPKGGTNHKSNRRVVSKKANRTRGGRLGGQR